MQMYCVKIYTKSYAMGLPLQILTPLNADFDGDVMNILWIINDEFFKYAKRVFNTRDAMFISRNNGYVNEDMLHSRETLMNWNTQHMLGIPGYSQDEIDKIRSIKEYSSQLEIEMQNKENI